MNVELDDAGRILLTTSPDLHHACYVTDDGIPPTTPYVEINTEHDWSTAATAEETINVKIGAVNRLIHSLERVHGTDEQLDIGHRLTYLPPDAETARKPVNCPVCGDRPDTDIERIVLHNGRKFSFLPIVHGDCIPDLIDTLQRTWDHAPELLARHA